MIQIGNHQFEGPFASTDRLQDRSGVYAILDRRNDGKYYVIDCGESQAVKTRVENHDRRTCWIRNSAGTLTAAVCYTPNLQQAGRMQVEQAIRQQCDPVPSIQWVRSDESVLIQLVDVLTGLVSSRVNGTAPPDSAKARLAAQVEERLGMKLDHTASSEKKFNIFRIKPGGRW